MSRVTSFSDWLLRQPIIWGGLACLAFYAFAVQGTEPGSFQLRYFAGHPIAYCTTALFFVGIAALVIKRLGLLLQSATLESTPLPSAAMGAEEPSDAEGLLASLDDVAPSSEGSYLVQRLRSALEYIQQKASADTLESHLKHLEDADYARMVSSYSMVRIITSTIPVLGFLGTVIGITLAIAKLNLSGEAMDESLPAVVAGLSVAFDTTALSLTLSIILLFVKSNVEQAETRLLDAVNANVSRQLVGRFRQFGGEKDPHLASVQRMSEQLLSTVETSVEKQSALMHAAFKKSGRQLSELLTGTATTLDEAMSGSVVEGLARHAELLNQGVHRHAGNLEETLVKHAELLNEGLHEHTAALTEAENKLAAENRRHLGDVEAAVGEAMLIASSRQEKLIQQSENLLKEMQIALVESAGSTVAQQEQLIKQGDILLRVVESNGQIKHLEQSLNNNLNALAGSHNFQQTVAGLSAALQLLGARLGEPMAATEKIELIDNSKQNQAA